MGLNPARASGLDPILKNCQNSLTPFKRPDFGPGGKESEMSDQTSEKLKQIDENFQLSKDSIVFWQKKMDEIYKKSLYMDNNPDEFDEIDHINFEKEYTAIFKNVEVEKAILSGIVFDINKYNDLTKRKK